MSFKPFIGKKSLVSSEIVTEEQIFSFCEATGTPHGPVAPATFMTLFRRGEFELFSQLGLKLSNVLHAEQEFQYFGSITPNLEIEFQALLVGALDKTSPKGSIHFLTFNTEVKEANTAILLGISKTTIVVKE